MKRLLALMLTVCLLAAPLSAGAQEKITTEELIVGVLELIVSGLQSGRLDMTYAESGSEYGLVLGEDASGTPGGMLSITEGGQTQFYGADGQGVFMSAGAWKEGDSLTGMSWESILRAVCTDENGVCWLPSFTEEDSQMLAGVGLQLVLSMADTVKVTESGSTIVIDVELGAFLDALDAAVPAALRAAAPQLDDFLARNNVVTYLLFDVEAPLTTETLIEIWSNLNIGDFVQGEMPLRLSITTDDETGDWNAVLAVADEGTITAQSTSGRIVATLTAEGETMVIFDTADLETVMEIVAVALHFMPEDAFSYEMSNNYGYFTLDVHFDLEKLLTGFWTSLSMAVLAGGEAADMLVERYFWLFEMMFDGTVVNGFTLASWLRREAYTNDLYEDILGWWRFDATDCEILEILFGETLPEFHLNLVCYDSNITLSAETNCASLYCTGVGEQFSGAVQLNSNTRNARPGRVDFSGLVTDGRFEVLATIETFQNGAVDAVSLVCTWGNSQEVNCTLSARAGGVWTELLRLDITPSGRRWIDAVLTDGQGTEIAELRTDETGFLFRTHEYAVPEKILRMLFDRSVTSVNVEPFEAELRVADNGGRIRIGGDEWFALEWMDGGSTSYLALMCREFTVSFTEEIALNAYGSFERTYILRYMARYSNAELMFHTGYDGVTVSSRCISNAVKQWDMSLSYDVHANSVQYINEARLETTTINYFPGSFVMQTVNLGTGIAETLEIVDVSQFYDNLNTTRVRWARARLGRDSKNVIEGLVVTNAPDAHTAVIDLISEGKTFSTLTVTNRPAVREAMPVRWLTEAETRAVLSLMLYALEDEPESTEEPAG